MINHPTTFPAAELGNGIAPRNGVVLTRLVQTPPADLEEQLSLVAGDAQALAAKPAKYKAKLAAARAEVADLRQRLDATSAELEVAQRRLAALVAQQEAMQAALAEAGGAEAALAAANQRAAELQVRGFVQSEGTINFR